MPDQQHRPARHPGGSRRHGGGFRLGPVLLGQPVQHPLGDGQFLPLGLDLLQLLGQLVGVYVSSLLRAVIRSSSRIPTPSHGLPPYRPGDGS
ncbi:hypothetical protein JIX56_46340 [Streptomyces sp. CA-210063]|uniref:hypothetical protein n=1 Tax=Streptomyces sp. CA-210063 TaxID=2801029 RepID=UPI00214AB01D|nr:hypothetical protein [Streptomyces sp. CA-210063]UUU36643.1 hypothetical protein JIX56_46340 [Streptomyces sp. CA-210063]